MWTVICACCSACLLSAVSTIWISLPSASHNRHARQARVSSTSSRSGSKAGALSLFQTGLVCNAGPVAPVIEPDHLACICFVDALPTPVRSCSLRKQMLALRLGQYRHFQRVVIDSSCSSSKRFWQYWQPAITTKGARRWLAVGSPTTVRAWQDEDDAATTAHDSPWKTVISTGRHTLRSDLMPAAGGADSVRGATGAFSSRPNTYMAIMHH